MSSSRRKAPLSSIEKIVNFMLVDPDHWLVKRHYRIHLINLMILQQRLSTLEDEYNAIVTQDMNAQKQIEQHQYAEEHPDLANEIQKTVKDYGSAFLWRIAM